MTRFRQINTDDFRRAAEAKLPSAIYHYLEGGAEDEWALRNATTAFEKYRLLPRVLTGNESQIDLGTRVLGCDLKMPLILSPVAGCQLFHPEKELAVARAASNSGIMMALSTLANSSIEEVALSSPGPKIFQLYFHKDRGLTRELISRAFDAKYVALCLTVDAPVAGGRERDRRSGFTMPPNLVRHFFRYAAKPRWYMEMCLGSEFRFANVDPIKKRPVPNMNVEQYIMSEFAGRTTWKDVEWAREMWPRPLAIKGITCVEDAVTAVSSGVTAIVISNHGGRQLDAAVAPVDCIRPIRDKVDRRLEIIVDGGIRRGSHIIRCLALGADCCAFGRPYLYALATGGQLGVEHYLRLIRNELERNMALMGCENTGSLERKHLFENVV